MFASLIRRWVYYLGSLLCFIEIWTSRLTGFYINMDMDDLFPTCVRWSRVAVCMEMASRLALSFTEFTVEWVCIIGVDWRPAYVCCDSGLFWNTEEKGWINVTAKLNEIVTILSRCNEYHGTFYTSATHISILLFLYSDVFSCYVVFNWVLCTTLDVIFNLWLQIQFSFIHSY